MTATIGHVSAALGHSFLYEEQKGDLAQARRLLFLGALYPNGLAARRRELFTLA